MTTFGRGIQVFQATPSTAGTVTNALNGTHLNGTIVYLGGPLLEPTTIDIPVSNPLTIGGHFASIFITETTLRLSASSNSGGTTYDLFFDPNNFTASFGYTDNFAPGFAGFLIFPGPPSGLGYQDTIQFAGMFYTDPMVNGIADHGDRYIPDYGDLKKLAPAIVSSWHTSNMSTNTTLVTYHTNVSLNGAFRISTALYAANTGVSTCKVSVTFTDQTFTVVTIDLGLPVAGASTNATYAPLTVQAAANTNIIVNFTVTGTGINASADGIIEQLLLF